jgi:PAS domain S-box-containing protein
MDPLLTYDELLERLNGAEEVIESLVSPTGKAVVSDSSLHLLRLHQTEEALRIAKAHLEEMLTQRTQELQCANERLLQEISERKEAQQRLASVIDSAMDAIITCDERMMVSIFNSAAEKIFGISTVQAVGSPLGRFIPGPITHTEDGAADLHRQNKSGGRMVSLWGIRANGEDFPIEATISHIEAGGEHLCTMILRDISQRKQTEAALIRSEKLASVGRVAAMIAHEINNPLSAIGNILFVLRDDAMSPIRKQYLALAEMEIQRAAKIAQNTLGFSRQSVHAERFRLSDLVDGVLLLLDRKLKEKSITLKSRCVPDDVEMVAVASEVRQVVWNLLTNAVDAVATQVGCIEVRVSRISSCRPGRETAIRITVADSGVGMDREMLSHLAEPFFTTKSHGTGLGLWVSHEIIRKHLGRLQVRSCTDPSCHGSVFSFLIPTPRSEPRPLNHR